MCGISGLWFESEIKEENLFKYGSLMSNALYKRGPDSEGILIEKDSSILFSHTRLAIKDPTINGSQPMVSSNGKFYIVFNGEIYNHKKIKAELKDHKWRGNSDTEILLTAIQEWGIPKTLNTCHGLFAIALWDRERKILTIARDRFGEKPLYWGRIKLRGYDKSVIAFTSDLSALWAIPEIEKEINYSAFLDLIKYGYICAPNSINKDIYQLKPGYYLEIKNQNGFAPKGNLKEVCWWDINKISSTSYLEQRLEKNEQILEESLNMVLKEQILADVPIASFLSGGIDSSLITALLQHQSPRNIKSFTISFPEKGLGESIFNEGPYAKRIADYLKTDHTEISLTSKDIKNVIPEIPNIYSEPFADVSQIATYLLCKEIRSTGIKVAIGGDGADELFGGYNRHHYISLIHRRFRNFPNNFSNVIAQIINFAPLNKEGISQEKRRKLISAIKNSKDIDKIYDCILSNNIKIEDFHNSKDYKESNLIKVSSLKAPTEEERVMLADSISYLPNDILVKLDRASMHVGLETRSPYLDERIAKIAWRMSLNEKISKKGVAKGKYPLREILFKLIPQEYFNRPKQGFSIPISSWLRGPLNEWANDMLSKNALEKHNLLSYKNIKRIWDLHLNGNSENTELIWSILMWQSWINKWEKVK